jgi:hypothetical protein
LSLDARLLDGLLPERVRPMIRGIGSLVIALSLAGAVGYVSFDRQERLLREVDYCAEHRQWNDVLTKANSLRLTAYTKCTIHDVNLALYCLGLLPNKLISFPEKAQVPGLFVPEQVRREPAKFRKPVDLLFDLGRINEAERAVLEMIEMWPTGRALKCLATTKMIKDQPPAARLVLNVLRDDLIWRDWAEEHLQRLAEDPHLAADSEMQHMRSLMVLEDDLPLTNTFHSTGVTINPKALLLSLLKRNGSNRMAFEYLMAIHLSNRDVDEAVGWLPYLDGLSYAEIPRHYEQALLVHLSRHPEQATAEGADLVYRGRKISPAALASFRRFREIVASHGGLNEKARAEAARELGDTYFYYYYCTPQAKP